MVKAHTFLMPDYYPRFKCKMGECRNACCEGWRVSLSLKDYFRLEGEECSAELRDKIDRGVKISLNPTPESYAYIQHDFMGNCPMRLSDGRCALHAEMGEDALAQVCRLYPRGIRINPDYECSCANSCEAVIEMLFKRDEPIKFIRQEAELELPENAKRIVDFATFGREEKLRLWLIGFLQDRNYSLPMRLMNLGLALKELQECLDKKDGALFDELTERKIEAETESFEVSEKHLSFGLEIAEKLIEIIDEKSESVREYGEKALLFFGSEGEAFERYKTAKCAFEAKFPKWEIQFEHMLVNHAFFEQFPFQDRPEDMWQEFLAIIAVYTLLRFLGIGYMAEREPNEEFVDMASAVFRFVDHTDFDRYASYVLTKLGCDIPEKAFDLIML